MSICALQCASTRSGLGIAGKEDIEIIMKKISEIEEKHKKEKDELKQYLIELEDLIASSTERSWHRTADSLFKIPINTLRKAVGSDSDPLREVSHILDEMTSIDSSEEEKNSYISCEVLSIDSNEGNKQSKPSQNLSKISLLEARVKELEDEVKFLKTLPAGLMETLGYKKI
jgi:hypothetical protein